ncbi:MAG: KpsF/GutQ family sugar-phosphate isomerase [Magnetovibrionaceae bacterium]
MTAQATPFPKAADQTPSSPDLDLERARSVLTLEAEGLTALAASLDQKFVEALDLLAGVKGRVIITGMGKSGHVARKIAATLASTGTPASFVHPGEASHGDLGMIRTDDAVLALSNSGETTELADLVAFTRRFHIPLIGMTSGPNSALAEASDVALVLPPVSEACPMGLAPTTSTTMMLGLGDALGVALLERRGFSSADFQVFHPGGKLGRRLLKVKDLMHGGEDLPLVAPETTMADGLIVMSAKGFGLLGVIDEDGCLIGAITDGDLRRHMAPDLPSLSVASVMTAGPKTIGPGLMAAEALLLMNENKITNLFVVEKQADDRQKPVGLLHVHDCLKAGVA